MNILVATDANDEFEDAIKANFLLDEDGDITTKKGIISCSENYRLHLLTRIERAVCLTSFQPERMM
jgi:hypothetical protein